MLVMGKSPGQSASASWGLPVALVVVDFFFAGTLLLAMMLALLRWGWLK
jgi:hypothetical protein